MEENDCPIGRLATLSREWQATIEQYNFARIRLTPARLVDFGPMTRRNRALVRYIWFFLELKEYDCTMYAPPADPRLIVEWTEVAYPISDTNDGSITSITTAFENLFSFLSTLDPSGDLVLDISIYSPSDSAHWFKYLTSLPDFPSNTTLDSAGSVKDTIPNQVYHDIPHGWVDGSQHLALWTSSINKVFWPVMDEGLFDNERLELEWWDQLPLIPAVTILLFRQQSRRR